MDIASGNIIKEIMQKYGKNVLLESRLLSLVADKLQNKDPQMLKRMRLAIDEGVPQKLHDLKFLNEHERGLKMNTIATVLDDLGMKTETAYEIVNYFGEALGYKPAEMPQSVTTPKSAIPQIKQPPPLPQVTATSTTGDIQPGSIIPFGGYDWRVLEVQNNKAFILSNKIIEERVYQKNLEVITWETCKLRSYLNGEFYNKFSSQDRARIAETRITTNNNPWYGTDGGSVTNDRIFLLSIEEVVKYFGDSGQFNNRPGNAYLIDDQYNSARIAKKASGTASDWWLRSPGDDIINAVHVKNDGTLVVYGKLIFTNCGVRPALWLNL